MQAAAAVEAQGEAQTMAVEIIQLGVGGTNNRFGATIMQAIENPVEAAKETPPQHTFHTLSQTQRTPKPTNAQLALLTITSQGTPVGGPTR